MYTRKINFKDSKRRLTDCLKEQSGLTNEEIGIVCSYFREEILGKEEPLFAEGSRYRKIVFVAGGILRLFVYDLKGDEIVKNFIEEGEFFSDIDSIEKDSPSGINVSAVSDCILLTISFSDAEKLVREVPRWEYLMKLGAMRAMNDMIRKQNFLRVGDSKDQYLYFVKNFPNLAQNVPLKYIASYLRVTQSSLSRIRRQTL